METKPILTAKVGDNSDLFPDILSLYLPEGSKIADVTCGNLVFWKKVDKSKYNLLATDLRPEHGGIDALKLPYENNSLDGWVYDPPYMHTPGSVKTTLARCYYNNNELKLTLDNIIDRYTLAAKEGLRCLKKKGIAIIKCQDQVSCGKQRLVHVDIVNNVIPLGFLMEDLFVMVQNKTPTMDPKWKKQYHARKNHSYFLIFRKK